MSGHSPSDGLQEFVAARDLLLRGISSAAAQFRWPQLDRFNWALDYFDSLAAADNSTALIVTNDAGRDERLSYAALAARSNQVANWLRQCGVGRGDALLVMLGNVTALWETMLAAMKLGSVIVPTSTLLARAELADRIERGRIRAIVTHAELTAAFEGLTGAPLRVAVGGAVDGWQSYHCGSNTASTQFVPDGPTRGSDPLLLYFTSGTTSRPKLVEHTHRSYPAGHLSTMYWIGLQPGDVHLNLSSPGWAKHAWSSFFAPWNAQATILAYQYERFSATALLRQLQRHDVTTFCAPPTVWRMLVQERLESHPVKLREAVSAGEPLNPEVIERVRAAWDLTIRDGFGQTETTAQIGNPPGHRVKPGAMGRALPGYSVVLLGSDGLPAQEGEICLDLSARPAGLMRGYADDEERTREVLRDGYYHTGDIASRDADGFLTYVGRADDVFKSSDYRISPFELESVLVEHAAVVEAAVVPMPDARRLAVPKAFVVLAAGFEPTAQTARLLLEHVRARVAPFKRVRCIEFCDLPKTVSGKIRRVDLRRREADPTQPAGAHRFHEDDPL